MKTWDEMTELEQMEIEFWDFYKEIHNVRPRWDRSDWTVEDYLQAFKNLENAE